MVTADQAIELARLRGEPEATISTFLSIKHWGHVIDGATFKRLCGGDKPAAASGDTGD